MTDLFCSERYVIGMASRFELVETKDISHTRGTRSGFASVSVVQNVEPDALADVTIGQRSGA